VGLAAGAGRVGLRVGVSEGRVVADGSGVACGSGVAVAAATAAGSDVTSAVRGVGEGVGVGVSVGWLRLQPARLASKTSARKRVLADMTSIIAVLAAPVKPRRKPAAESRLQPAGRGVEALAGRDALAIVA